MWFTEDAWSPIILCVVAGVIFFIAWSTTRKPKLLLALPLLLLAALTIFFAEQAIVTPLEKLESTLFDLIDTFVRESRDMSLQPGMTPEDLPPQIHTDDFFAARNNQDRARVVAALLLVNVGDDLSIKDVDIKVTNEDTRAVTRFRANGTVTAGSFSGHRPSYWELQWQIEANEWKITRTLMLDVVTGEAKPIPRVD